MNTNAHPEPGARKHASPLLAVLVVAAVLWGAVQRFHGLTRPPGQDAGINGLIARNYLKYGFPDAGLAQIVSPGPVRPAEERLYYVTHPPLARLFGAAGVGLLGPTALALRLPHVVADVAAVTALAFLAARLFGPAAAAWCVIAAATMPVVGTYSLSLAGPVGMPLILAVSMAAACYAGYSATGGPWYYAGVLLFLLLACLADWAVYALPFLLAAHALVYRSRARWRRLLVPVVLAVLLAGGLVSYALRIPVRQHLYGGLYFAFSGWSEGPAIASLALTYTFGQWLAVVGRSLAEQLTPFAALAAVWALGLVPRAVFTRRERPAQHLLLLWVWPLPYMAIFHRVFYIHPHYQVLFLPAVVVTLGALGARLYNGSTARRGAWRGVLAVTGAGGLILWSHHFTAAWQDPRAEVRRQTVRWAEDIASHTAPDEASAFVGHYAMQMRFLADRVVHEEIHSLRQLERAGAGDRAPSTLFAPLAYPVLPVGLGETLMKTLPACAGRATLAFSLEEGRPPAPTVRRLEGVALDHGIAINRIEFATFSGAEGRRLLYFAPIVVGLPDEGPGESVQWNYRVLSPEGRVRGAGAVSAKMAASYFLRVPRDWSLDTGRVELVLTHVTTDAAEVSRWTRLARFALRLVTLSHLGRPKQLRRPFLTRDGSPIVLSAFPGVKSAVEQSLGPARSQRPAGHSRTQRRTLSDTTQPPT